MIPNIFLSSTVTDLHYLRDALRDAIIDLAYTPIMSDYGEIGYLNANTAAESCYRTVRQCQLAILVIGRKYGRPDKDGYSVTHREFLTAKEHHIPIITFVESHVINYKEVFDADPTAPTWNNFPGMDAPQKTFSLINEVKSSDSYNGIIPITAAGEAKRLLKIQIADFVGERLNDAVRPVKNEVQEILAELKTLRKEIAPGQPQNLETQKYLRTMRFLLDDQVSGFRKFCERVCGDLDSAVPLMIKNNDFDAFLAALKIEKQIEDDREAFNQIMVNPNKTPRIDYASQGGEGWWAQGDNRVVFNTSQFEKFRQTYDRLKRKLESP
jgi:hypothetical protein